jgi:hypothetical protein
VVTATAVMVAMAAATRPIALTSAPRTRKAKSGADRFSVVLFSIAAFLLVLALLAWQLKAPSAHVAARPVVVMKRIYTTTVVTTVPGRGRTSMSQSVSSSGSAYAAASAPTTRTS